MTFLDRFALVADTIFDGCTAHPKAAVVIAGGRIEAVLPSSQIPPKVKRQTLAPGLWLVPGFIDVQVNGGGDILFNNTPTIDAILSIATAHRKFGTTALLATLITDTPNKVELAMRAVRDAMRREPSILGIHLEGPYLSPEKAGVHDRSLMRIPSERDVELLCRNREGSLVVTLAPERVPPGFIAQLVNSGIRVSLGHSMATYEQTRQAMSEGLSGFTHLFNAMRPLTSRDPGPIAAALESPDAWYGLIADGFHVSPPVLKLALRGEGRPMLVTDAMPPVGGRQTNFELYGERIDVIEGRCVRPDGTLAGAALDMASAVRNCVHLLELPLERALQFASLNPAEFLGLGHILGRLKPGYRADMVALDPSTWRVDQTWIAGKGEALSSS